MSNDTVKTVDLEKIRDDYKAAAARIQRRIIIYFKLDINKFNCYYDEDT